VKQRVVQGTAEAIAAVLEATGTGHGIHTAYIEETVPKRVHQLESKPWRAMSMARWP